MLGIVAVGVVRESRKLRAPMYMAHRAVIFATAQLSCLTTGISQFLTDLCTMLKCLKCGDMFNDQFIAHLLLSDGGRILRISPRLMKR